MNNHFQKIVLLSVIVLTDSVFALPPGADQHAHDAVQARKPLEPPIDAAIRELVSTSHEGLKEEKTANGVKVELNGRFRAAPVATINERGEVDIVDYTSPPEEVQ